jgi:hypothetical protein
VFIGNRFAIPAGLKLEARGNEHAFSCNIISQPVVIHSAGTFYDSSNTDNGLQRPLTQRLMGRQLDTETKQRVGNLMDIHAATEREGEKLRFEHMKKQISQARASQGAQESSAQRKSASGFSRIRFP